MVSFPNYTAEAHVVWDPDQHSKVSGRVCLLSAELLDLGMAEQAAKKIASPLYLGFDFSTQQVGSKLSLTALHTKQLTVKYADYIWGSGLGTGIQARPNQPQWDRLLHPLLWLIGSGLRE